MSMNMTEEVHYPLIFGVYNGERIEPDKDLDRDGVNYCTDEEGQRILFPREIGIYTVLCRISLESGVRRKKTKNISG